MTESKTMLQSSQVLQPNTLWQQIKDRTAHALYCGALQPIATMQPVELSIEQDGIHFLVRVVPNLVRRGAAKPQATSDKVFNPFLPYEADLFVTDLTDTHLCLLNKFNVMDYHTLIVTRAFEEQETPLTLNDFEAMWLCLAELDGLIFYNSGEASGGSQPHRHFHLVPLPFASQPFKLPIESAIAQAQFSDDGIGTVPAFPFVHAIASLSAFPFLSAAPSTLSCYHRLLQEVGLLEQNGPINPFHLKAYNLLVTRDWMLLVPRTQAGFASISINALGFAGVILVQDELQLQFINNECSPMAILQAISAKSINSATL